MKIQLKDIPLINSPERRHLLNFTKEEFYKEELKKGSPFFSEKELIDFEKKFEDGMTKEDLWAEIKPKGWLKENTIKSYIQKGLLPRSQKRVKTDKGMISIYPSNMFRHLNFTRYCLISDTNAIQTLFLLLKRTSDNDHNILIDASLEIDDSGFDGEDCINSLWIGYSRLTEYGIPWTKDSLEKVFSNQERKKRKYLKKVTEIEMLAEELGDKIRKFEKLLANNSSPSDLVATKSMEILHALMEKSPKVGKESNNGD